MRDVAITITNVDEAGTVTLSSEQPKIGIPLTAALEDPDGVVADSVKWTWHSNDTTDATAANADNDYRDGYVRHLHTEGGRCGYRPVGDRRATPTEKGLARVRLEQAAD